LLALRERRASNAVVGIRANIMTRILRFTLALVAGLFVLCPRAVAEPTTQAPQPVATIDLFRAGSEGFHTFRIPVLLASKRGTLLAFCEGRRDGIADHGTIFLLLKRSFDQGRTWQPVQIVWREEGRTSGNPAPVVDDATGRILLLFCRNNNSVYLAASDDDGASWNKPRNLTRDVRLPDWEWYATGPSPGVCLREGKPGRLVVPCNHSARLGDTVAGRAHAIYSDDGGETWRLGQPVPVPDLAKEFATEMARAEARHRRDALGTAAAEPAEPDTTPHSAARAEKTIFAGNEAAIVELPGGLIMMNTRGSARGALPQRAVSFSRDGGETWTLLRHDAAVAHCSGPKRASSALRSN